MNRFTRILWLARKNFTRSSVLNYGAMLVSGVALLVFMTYFLINRNAVSKAGGAVQVIELLFWVVLLLCFVSLFMAFFINSRFRYHEIGVLRALGAGRGFIFFLFYFETFFFTAAGIAVACFGAVLIKSFGSEQLVALLNRLVNDWSFWNLARSGLSAFAVALFISFAAVSYPAWLSCRVEPYNAIRNRE